MSWNFQPFFSFQDRRMSSIGVSDVLLILSHVHSICHSVGWSFYWSIHWLVGRLVSPSICQSIHLKRYPNHITAPAPSHTVMYCFCAFRAERRANLSYCPCPSAILPLSTRTWLMLPCIRPCYFYKNLVYKNVEAQISKSPKRAVPDGIAF